MAWDDSIFDLTFLQEYPLLKTSIYDHSSSLVPIVNDMELLQEPFSPPPGTILMYSSKKSLQLDKPEVVGTMGQLAALGVGRRNSLHAHFAIRNTIKDEFELEDKYHRLSRRGRQALPRDKRRRNSMECEWKPESVYKTYVDCKPAFFEKSDYQDHIPASSCFGKINMRIPKAWSRGPNRPKRRRVRAGTSSEGSISRLSSSVDQEDIEQIQPSFNPHFNSGNPLAFDFFFP